MEQILVDYGQYVVVFLAVLGAASAIARITPNKSDDKIVNKIWKIVNALGLRGGPTLCVCLMLLSGCVTDKTRCVYDPDNGRLKYSMSRSTVIGKGKINNTVIACKSLTHKSTDTGIDEGAVLLGAAIADAARKATLAGAAGGVLEDVIKDLKWNEVPSGDR